MRLYIATDHAGFDLKENLKAYLESNGHEIVDYGAQSFDSTDDYPDFITPLALAIQDDGEALGVIIGSSGEGEAMAANRIDGVRAAVYYGDKRRHSESKKVGDEQGIIESARRDNDANILSLGASFISFDEARDAVMEFIDTPFSEEERHIRRINKLDQ